MTGVIKHSAETSMNKILLIESLTVQSYT